MGGVVEANAGASMKIAVRAEQDVGTLDAPGRGLSRMQIIKGWVDAEGVEHVEVIDVDASDDPGAVDEATCEPLGSGSPSLCSVWTDEAYDPSRPTFYYARVLEAPVCRWSWRDCLSLPVDQRPEICDDPSLPRTIHERAWTSPVWSYPAGG